MQLIRKFSQTVITLLIRMSKAHAVELDVEEACNDRFAGCDVTDVFCLVFKLLAADNCKELKCTSFVPVITHCMPQLLHMYVTFTQARPTMLCIRLVLIILTNTMIITLQRLPIAIQRGNMAAVLAQGLLGGAVSGIPLGNNCMCLCMCMGVTEQHR